MPFFINIRLPDKSSLLLEIEKEWTTDKLKEEISTKTKHLDKNSIKIIFCGQEISGEETLKGYDLGENSTLHVIEVKSAGETAKIFGPAAGIQREIAGEGRRVKYFVYCKAVCGSVQPGKLRVRCKLCKDGAITLEREPRGWMDVLRQNVIGITCHTKDCTGNKAEFYFKCGQHSSVDDYDAVVLNLVCTNTTDAVCLTCGDISDPVLKFPCAVQHIMCLECFREYCLSKLNERGFQAHPEYGYTVACPAGCEDSLIQESHHFRIMGNEQYSRYQQFGAEEWVLKERGVLCPAPGCGQGWITNDSGRRLQCSEPQGCGMVFCAECREAYHEGECDLASIQQGAIASINSADLSQTQQDRLQSLDTIHKTTKSCPKCSTPVERSGGCMHMHCIRCKHEWCWLCLIEWNSECQSDHWFGDNPLNNPLNYHIEFID
ncbi:unnamed protein product [Owenia fusiformis]|uniref:E3 ubiquitin-protein ligase parkin n=1 Tax=Owenia fusiformis TaxID=6347 RepID=A0A8J1XJ95_OWEFU|nr:unnamed protein product [Owenia fusiformis]